MRGPPSVSSKSSPGSRTVAARGGAEQATIRVRRPSGAVATFDAEHAFIDHGLVTATGRWSDDRERRRRTYTWRSRQVIEIRWVQEPLAA
jgi:hypothetical protein